MSQMLPRLIVFGWLAVFAVGIVMISSVIAPTAVMADDDDGDDDDDDGDDDDGGSRGASGSPGDRGDWRSFRPTERPRVRRTRPIQRRQRRAPRRFARGREVVVSGLTDAQIARLQRNGFRVTGDRLRDTRRLTRLVIPRTRSRRSARRFIRRVARDARIARNNLYRRPRQERFLATGQPCGTACPAFELTRWNTQISRCRISGPIGMIDTPVDAAHPTLRGASVTTLATVRKDRRPARTDNGTAVASLFVGRSGSDVAGVVPQAELVAVNAFHRSGRVEQADTFDLVEAIDALVERGVAVINMSLTGPGNPFLRAAIERARSKNIAIVAAVGHRSRSAGYPARYPGVIAVSSIDARMRPSRRNARGGHVMFAAPGTGVIAAAPGTGVRIVEGSSFAAPFVAAAYAIGATPGQPDAVTDLLADSAMDLGKPGRDPVFGWGLMQYNAIALAHCADS